MTNIIIKRLCDSPCNIKNGKSLYYKAFPKNERRPFPEFLDHRLGDTEAFCFLDGDLFIGMGVVMNSPTITHITYLAIDENFRCHGYGSKALKLIHEYYSGKRIMVDIELPDGASVNEEERLKRKSFYLRNGYKETEIKYNWRHEKYEILSFGGAISRKEYDNFWKCFNIKKTNISEI